MRRIDMSKDPRRKQFEYFRTFPNPYASLTANCDITHLRQTVLENSWPFFLTVLYCAVNAANAVPELRRRIVNGEVVEYDHCLSSHTVALPDETYCYCEMDCSGPFEQYLPRAQVAVEQAKQTAKLEDGEDSARLFFVTSVPWVSFTSVCLPVPDPPDSNVRITFGKFFGSSLKSVGRKEQKLQKIKRHGAPHVILEIVEKSRTGVELRDSFKFSKKVGWCQ